ncbi:MAG: FGGY-family carbohydrate kinase, partial [Mycobacteriales bacterium]
RPQGVGLLYGDRRGRTAERGQSPAGNGEAEAFLAWQVDRHPGARGYWPAQAVAAVALGGEPTVDLGTAATAWPLFTGTGWDADRLAALGIRPDQLPQVAPTGTAAGTAGELVLAPGTVDALAEQIVSGAGEPGDVLVLCGTTLITWIVVDAWTEVPDLWSVPWHAPGRFCVGGPSNAGGLFLNWARSLLAGAGDPDGLAPGRVPVWEPYPRGERVPLHDPDRRGCLHGLDLTMGPVAVRRACYEAAGFVVADYLARAGLPARRIIATGGGIQDPGWLAALADATGLAVLPAAVPEGAALGAAWLARMALGWESSLLDAARWARHAQPVEPDPRWVPAVAERFARFCTLSRAAGCAGPTTEGKP